MAHRLIERKFGARYGKSVRSKYAQVENKQRKMQKCPSCGKKAKRTSKGIWECTKCKRKFASHVYYLQE